MGRRKETLPQRKARWTLICEGKTECCYFMYLQELKIIKGIKKKPKFNVEGQIGDINRHIKETIKNQGHAIVVFDMDVTENNKTKKKILNGLKCDYANNKDVIICDGKPSIEYWFLLHYQNRNRWFANADEVIEELRKYISGYDKHGPFLDSPKWVEAMSGEGSGKGSGKGSLADAVRRAKEFGEKGGSYSNVWKAIERTRNISVK